MSAAVVESKNAMTTPRGMGVRGHVPSYHPPPPLICGVKNIRMEMRKKRKGKEKVKRNGEN